AAWRAMDACGPDQFGVGELSCVDDVFEAAAADPLRFDTTGVLAISNDMRTRFDRTAPVFVTAFPLGHRAWSLVLTNAEKFGWAHRMYFVGKRDSATLIRSGARKTGFIAIEFRPHGAFPIFGVPMSETANRLWETDSVFGPWSREVQGTVNNLEHVEEKVAYI